MADGTNVTVTFMNLSFPMVLFLQMLGEHLKVRALRGDEYLKKLDSIPAGDPIQNWLVIFQPSHSKSFQWR